MYKDANGRRLKKTVDQVPLCLEIPPHWYLSLPTSQTPPCCKSYDQHFTLLVFRVKTPANAKEIEIDILNEVLISDAWTKLTKIILLLNDCVGAMKCADSIFGTNMFHI